MKVPADRLIEVSKPSGLEESAFPALVTAGRGGAILMVSRGVNMLSQLCLVLVISRHLGQEALGAYSFVVSTTILGVYISSFGLDTLLTRTVSRQPVLAHSMVPTLLGLRLLSSAVAFLTINLLFLVTPLDVSLRMQLLVCSATLLFGSLSFLLWSYADALEQFALHGVLWAAINVAKAVLGCCILLLGGSLLQALSGMVLSEAAGLIATWVAVDKRVGKLYFSGRWTAWWRAIQDSWPLAISALLGAVAFRIDVVVIQVLRGSHEVGLYSAAFKVVEVMQVLPSSMALASFPRLSRTLSNGTGFRTESFFKRVLTLMLGLGFVIAAILFLAAPNIIQLLYGPGFPDSVRPLQILAFKILLMFLNLPLSYALIAMGDERRATLWTGMAAMANIAANFLWVPDYGRIGAAYASVMAEGLLLTGFASRTFRMHYRRKM